MTSSSRPRTSTTRTSNDWVRPVTLVIGVVFVLVGIAGFIPGLTTNYGSLGEWGHHSEATLLGIFNVSILHNLVHIAFGVAGLLLARNRASATIYLLVGGAIYLVLWIYGLVIDQQTAINFVPVNDADNWLHLVLGVAMVGLGTVARLTGRDVTRSATSAG